MKKGGFSDTPLQPLLSPSVFLHILLLWSLQEGCAESLPSQTKLTRRSCSHCTQKDAMLTSQAKWCNVCLQVSLSAARLFLIPCGQLELYTMDPGTMPKNLHSQSSLIKSIECLMLGWNSTYCALASNSSCGTLLRVDTEAVLYQMSTMAKLSCGTSVYSSSDSWQ